MRPGLRFRGSCAPREDVPASDPERGGRPPLSSAGFARVGPLLLALCAASALLVAAPAHRAAAAPPESSAAPGDPAADPDTDGDGLSDFQETHKYLTDPAKADSDGDGVPDGDWDERRECAYSVRTLVAAMPPAAAVSDDFQDARVLDRIDASVEIEIVTYPYADGAKGVPADRDWRAKAAALSEWTRPNLTADFDGAFRARVVADAKADGIDLDVLSDKDLAVSASLWALARTNVDAKCFTTHFVEAKDGKVVIRPGLEAAFETGKAGAKRSDAQQVAHETLGKAMYAAKTRGSCTSTAVYQETVLRALGLPTRVTIAIPPADASDRFQTELLRDGIRHGPLQRTVLKGVAAGGSSYASHTFLDVFVGGRWRRMNEERLGAGVVDGGTLGLMLRVMTFDDLATAGLAATWGRRYALQERTARFPASNPYRLLDCSDRVGVHSTFKLEQAAPRRDHERLTITAARWSRYEVKGRPGRVLELIAAEWFDDQDGDQYARFTRAADRSFVLRAAGQPDVPAECMAGSFTDGAVHGVMLFVPEPGVAAMKAGTAYHVVPSNGSGAVKWVLGDGVTIAK